MLEEFLEEKYPKKINLKNGEEVKIRPVTGRDFEPLFSFFRNLPAEEKLYLQQDVSNPKTVKEWLENLDYWDKLPLVVEKGNQFIAYASLYQTHHGWMRSIGVMRIITAPKYRKQGLGKQLIDGIIELASYFGLEKLSLETVGEQETAAFQKFGFEVQARLPEYVKDFSGKLHDYCILVYDLRLPEEERDAK